MKKTFFFFLIILNTQALFSNEVDSILHVLKDAIKNKQVYAEKKEIRIHNLKHMLQLKDLSPNQEFSINDQLYIEYRKYKVDSAIVYAEKNLDIAIKQNDKEIINKVKLELAPLYSTGGLYIESKNILESINPHSLNKKLKAEYYYAYSLFYTQYVQSNNKKSYYKQKNIYGDSLLNALDPKSFEYTFAISAIEIFEKKEYDKAKKRLTEFLDKSNEQDGEYAMLTYMLGILYKETGQIELEKKYFALSAIADIRNAIKDNASIQNLALVLYEAGDIDLAHACSESSLEDAIFCNVRYRTIESSNSYPIITGTYQLKEKKSKEQLQNYLVAISSLSLFFIAALIYIYRQMKRLSRIRKKLYRTNLQVNESNQTLLETNSQLEEANLIKEEYIAYSFDIFSAYISKLEDFKNKLNKKVQTRKIEEVAKELSSNDLISTELKEFYNNFDRIFLGIYPHFIEEFNALLVPEERIKIKAGDPLNTELRIFALIRLGISDSTKISTYLHYSLSTIYNYRTKMRNKSAVPRDEFETYVMKIGSHKRN